jgi:CHAT domain-containing protein
MKPLTRRRGKLLMTLRVGVFPPLELKHNHGALFKCITLLLLTILPITAFAQSTKPSQISNTDELFSALLSVKTEDRPGAAELLETYRRFITPYLWLRLMNETTRVVDAGEAQRSLFILGLARKVAGYLGNAKFIAYSSYRIGSALFAQNEFNKAVDAYLVSKENYEKAKSPRDLIPVLSELGDLHTYTDDYKKAEEYSEKSLALANSLRDSKEPMGALPDNYGIATAWSNLGKVSIWKGDYKTAAAHFQKSLGLWEGLNGGGSLYKAHIINSLTYVGISYQLMGDHTHALNYLGKALELAKSLTDKDRLATVLANIGVLYMEQCDYSKASEFYNQGLAIFTSLNNKREMARTLINLGVVNQRLRNYDSALERFWSGLKKAEEVAAPDIIIAAQEGLGTVYYEQGKYPEALNWFGKAESSAQTMGDKIRMTELLWRKGQVLYAQGDFVKSGALARDAADLAIQLGMPIMTYLSLTLKGKAYRAQKSYDMASESFKQAIEAIEQMRDQVAGGEKERQIFFEDKISPYHEVVSLLIQQNNSEEALRYAERARARVLLDVLRNGRINTSKSLTQEQQLEEQRLYGQIVSLNTQVRVERTRPQRDDAHIAELDADLIKARNAYEVFQSALYSAHPELKAKRGLFPAFEIQSAAAVIPDSRTALLEYVVTDERTFLFVLSRGRKGTRVDVKVYPINIKSNELYNLAEEFRKLISVNHPGFRQPGGRLYELLVKPAEEQLRAKSTLCIVPDGPLWDLPFQALQNDEDKYLLELYAMYYAPSLQVLGEMRKKAANLHSSFLSRNSRNAGASSLERQPIQQLYAIGNPEISGEVVARAQTVRNRPFVSLPETEKEVQTIGDEVYGAKASSIHIGAAAREDIVKTEMGRYRVIHFATHGVLNDGSPLYSYLLLAPGENSNEDGLLEAWELMEMDLQAEMVVLSACDTARGHVSTGEGMIGMTWALFVAGVPTTVASQWKVPSETTTKLMVAFHKNARQMSKAEALRGAALEMIKDPRYRMKPFYWAGFVVVGDGGM